MSPQEEEKRFQEETAPKEWLRLGQMNEDGVEQFAFYKHKRTVFVKGKKMTDVLF